MLTKASTPTAAAVPYIASIDLMRGLVMIIMALDHVRWYFSDADFSPTDLTRTDLLLFLTRWVTHLCAPVFVFLSGTSAFLSATRGLSRLQLASRLFTRGLWLIVLEPTVVHFAWAFNLDYSELGLGVIWALGWSMVVLSMLVYLPLWAIGSFGVSMILAHNLLDGIRLEDFLTMDGTLEWQGWLLSVLHIPHSPVVYPLIPWIGVMAAGYAFGAVMLMTQEERKQILLRWGLILIAAFVALRAYNGYGDPHPWLTQATGLFTALSFLNTTKYPPSLAYLLMTLGSMLVLLSVFERQITAGMLGIMARLLIVFGRVPLFFYLLHLYVIHGMVIVMVFAMGRDITPFFTYFDSFPSWWGFSLSIVYLVWAGVVLLLYPICQWVAKIKSRHQGSWWTPYI